MQERIPDFIIGGAPRSGTTWLSYLLERHPQIYMAKPLRPEPKFFLLDELYERGIEFYCRTWFADVPRGALAGEKSTNYLESEKAAERICRHLPRVKLVFILRDPVRRAYSNYLWSRQNGLETEDFATAITSEPQRERGYTGRLRYSRPHSYISRGFYARLLRRYLDRFPREQILVLRFEDIIGRPTQLATRLHRFLGVAPRPNDAQGLGVINPAEQGDQTLAPELRRRLEAIFAEPNRELAELLGPDCPGWSQA